MTCPTDYAKLSDSNQENGGAKMAILFETWCEHYGYDPESERAAEDWGRYLIEREFAESLFAEPEPEPEPVR